MLTSYIAILLLCIFSASILLLCASIITSTQILVRIIMMSAISSALSCIYLLLDAPDVALTESSINAAISSILFIILASRVEIYESKASRVNIVAGAVAALSIFLICCDLSYILPEVGNANNPINLGISAYYTASTKAEIGIPAIVTAVLADYRGFDTFGETLVIFIAGMSVYIILRLKDAKK